MLTGIMFYTSIQTMIKLDLEYYSPGNITPRMLPTKVLPSRFLPYPLVSFLECPECVLLFVFQPVLLMEAVLYTFLFYFRFILLASANVSTAFKFLYLKVCLTDIGFPLKGSTIST